MDDDTPKAPDLPAETVTDPPILEAKKISGQEVLDFFRAREAAFKELIAKYEGLVAELEPLNVGSIFSDLIAASASWDLVSFEVATKRLARVGEIVKNLSKYQKKQLTRGGAVV